MVAANVGGRRDAGATNVDFAALVGDATTPGVVWGVTDLTAATAPCDGRTAADGDVLEIAIDVGGGGAGAAGVAGGRTVTIERGLVGRSDGFADGAVPCCITGVGAPDDPAATTGLAAVLAASVGCWGSSVPRPADTNVPHGYAIFRCCVSAGRSARDRPLEPKLALVTG